MSGSAGQADMTDSSRASLLVGVIVLVVILAAWAGWQYKSNADRADRAEEQAQQTTAITTNVISAMTLFNQISQAATDEKQQNSEKSTARVVVIKEAVKSDDCAVKSVPAAAADSLREHRNKIRAGSAGAATGRPDG